MLSSLFQPPWFCFRWNVQHAAVGQLDRLLGHEDRLARHVAAAGAGVDAPGRLVLAVDGERDRPGDALLARSCRRSSAPGRRSGLA